MTGARRARVRRSVLIALLSAASILAAAIGAEAILRFGAPVADGDVPGRFSRGPYYTRYVPGARYAWKNEDGLQVPIRIDERGFRNPPGSLEDCDAILLGDSFAAGLNTPEDSTLAGRLRGRGLKVYDAGVDMFSNGEALQVLKDLLRVAHPRAVILAMYLGNDFRDNLFVRPPKPPASGTAARLKEAYFYVAERSLLLQGLHNRIYLGFFRGKAADPMASFALSEMISYRNAYPRDMEKAVARTDSILGDFAQEAERGGFRCVVLGIPSKAQVLRSFKEIAMYEADARSRAFALATIRAGYSFDKPDSVARALAEGRGIPYLSLLPLFRARFDAQPYYKVDTHWRAVGQGLAADALWESRLVPQSDISAPGRQPPLSRPRAAALPHTLTHASRHGR